MKRLALSFSVVALVVLSSSRVSWGQLLERPTLTPLVMGEMPATMTSEPAASASTQASHVGDADRWNLSLSIPVWLASVDGDVVIRGRELSVDQGAADDVDELFDSRLNGAAALHFEAQRNRFGVLLEGMYIDRGVEGTLDATDAEGFLRGFVGEVAGIYTVVPPDPEKQGWGKLRVDALGGVRVSALELGIDSDAFNAAVHRTFYDPYVGGRVEVGLTRWLSFHLRGDVGGFGITAWSASDFSWNIDTLLRFRLASWFDLGLGYRWLDYDFNGPSNSSLSATISGPVIELKFNF